MQTLQTTLASVAALAAVVGMLFALLGRRGARAQSREGGVAAPGWTTLTLWIAVAAVVLFLPTLLSREPFSPGNTLGPGFLIGAALGIFALYLSATGAEESGLPDTIGLVAAAVLGPAVVLILFKGYPTEALGGCALGSVFAACAARSLTPFLSRRDGDETDSSRPSLRGMEVFGLTAATLFAGVRLGMEHFPHKFPNDPAGGYWSAPVLLLGVGALALCLMPGRWGGRPALPIHYGAAAGAVATVTAAVLKMRLLPDLLWPPVLYGLIGFVLLLYLVLQDSPAEEDARSVSAALGAVFLTLAVVALSFQQLQAYGQALALIPAALLAATFLMMNGRTQALAGGLGAGAWTLALLLTLYRVFVEGTGRGRPLDFQSQYDVVALLLGLCGAFALLNFAQLDTDSVDARTTPPTFLPRALLLGFAVTAAPLAIAVAWGIRATGAYLVGLPLAEAAWMLLAAWSVGSDRRKVLAAAPHLFLAATALVAVQLAPFVLDLELKRAQRIGIVGVLAVVALAVLLTASARRSRPAPLEARHDTAV